MLPFAARNTYVGLCPALMYLPEPSESSVNKNIVTKRLAEDFSQRNRFNRLSDSCTGTFARNCICRQPSSMELNSEAELPFPDTSARTRTSSPDFNCTKS